ncbi:MAG: universal stress protein [Oligoflexia bacterium]|nr:universal stress protein [Oligoflexia bacterium]
MPGVSGNALAPGVQSGNPMRTSERRRMVIWALDPLSSETRLQQASLRKVHAVAESLHAEVQPAYVYGRIMELGPSGSPWLESIPASRTAIESRVDRLLRKLDAPPMAKPMGLFVDTQSTVLRAQELADYASRSGALAIFCETHARKGLGRFFLGSFTEALLLRSAVPVISVSPAGTRRTAFNRILFATDFGPYSRRALREVIDLAKELRSELTLLHVLPTISTLVTLSELASYPHGPLGRFPSKGFPLDDLRESARQQLDRMAAMARAEGVTVQLVLSEKVEPVAEAVLREVRKRRIGLIALEAESGRLSSALLGSVSRQVIRRAPCPVWTIRSRLAFAKPARQTGRKPTLRAA